jgi:hypothetical protein
LTWVNRFLQELLTMADKAMTDKAQAIPTMWLGLKAPVELFERLDRWREQQVARPSRPASIRWIVHQFLLKQEQGAARRGKRKQAKRPGRAKAKS